MQVNLKSRADRNLLTKIAGCARTHMLDKNTLGTGLYRDFKSNWKINPYSSILFINKKKCQILKIWNKGFKTPSDINNTLFLSRPKTFVSDEIYYQWEIVLWNQGSWIEHLVGNMLTYILFLHHKNRKQIARRVKVTGV